MHIQKCEGVEKDDIQHGNKSPKFKTLQQHSNESAPKDMTPRCKALTFHWTCIWKWFHAWIRSGDCPFGHLSITTG